jgi:hypothetical protein
VAEVSGKPLQKKLLRQAATERLTTEAFQTLVNTHKPAPEDPTERPKGNSRAQAFAIRFSVPIEDAKHGQIVFEQAVALIEEQLADRGVTPSNFSTTPAASSAES